MTTPRRLLLAVCACLVLPGCGARGRGAASESGPKVAAIPATAIRFEDAAAASGIGFRWPTQKRPLGTKEAFGCGCAFLDFDNDGWQDILLVAKPHAVLYRSIKGRRFEDVTARMGLDKVTGDWKGCAVGDTDGDGFLDILLTGFHRLALLQNERGERFSDMTAAAGLSPTNHGHWGSSAGFMDLDGDGTLDLIIVNYVRFGPNTPDYCTLAPGVKSGCPPSTYQSEYPELWQNAGGGRFRDATAHSGLNTTHGTGLILTFFDGNEDGRPDFYIGNDGLLADLMQNEGRLRFKNVGNLSGISAMENGDSISAMGADWGDYNRDGRPDLAVSNFSRLPFQLFENTGDGLYRHEEAATGLASPTVNALGFGTKWIDVDNDGWPDLLFANGHVYDNPGAIDGFSTFRQRLMLFQNQNGKRFTDIAPALGVGLTKPILGRGLATGDYDNDGKMDALIVDYEGSPLLLHNRTRTADHWLTLDIRGAAPNTFAYGARVTARAEKQVWVGSVSPASSYLSSSDPRIHFGLGPVARLDTITIQWLDGQKQVLRDVRADRILPLSPPRIFARGAVQ